MGDGYGPMLVSRNRAGLSDNPRLGEVRDWLRTKRIAIPGTMTSAYLALRLAMIDEAHPAGDCEIVVVPFDEIFHAVKTGHADVGLIIHEGQLTYANENLELILDLGVWWKIKTGLPLPLGGNVIRKDIAPENRTAINVILRESIRYGLEHRAAGVAHAMPLARGLDTQLADRFIGMYVNDYTLDYGDKGRRAIREFLGQAHAAGLIPAPVELEFVE
jgi:1,4-dihydroxy-6-naphthoate synthase